jgi:hypothetical protein
MAMSGLSVDQTKVLQGCEIAVFAKMKNEIASLNHEKRILNSYCCFYPIAPSPGIKSG